MNKRENVLSLIDPGEKPAYIPAAFFLHFDPLYHRGQAAVDQHLKYFHSTGMDFVKIQYEHTFPFLPEIERPEDWSKVPVYPPSFFADPLAVVEGIVKAVKKDALVVMTLYSPFMIAGQVAGAPTVTRHIQEDSQRVKPGLATITESLMNFVQGCIERGVDGFYHSTQGGETGRFSDRALFEECVKPYDLTLMEEINRRCIFNILHVCDYHAGYTDLTAFLDYPGHVVNASLHLGEKNLTTTEVARLFGRPYMGGLDRKGVLATGNPDEIRQAVIAVLEAAPERFILAADCTVPSETAWENLRTAIDTAHHYLR